MDPPTADLVGFCRDDEATRALQQLTRPPPEVPPEDVDLDHPSAPTAAICEEVTKKPPLVFKIPHDETPSNPLDDLNLSRWTSKDEDQLEHISTSVLLEMQRKALAMVEEMQVSPHLTER